MKKKLSYESPSLSCVGDFKALTQGGSVGTAFDGNFTQGQPAPLDRYGRPLIFS